MARRRQATTALALLCVTLLAVPWVGQPSFSVLKSLGAKRVRRCAVINPVGFHADVAAGFAWAFQEAGCNVTAYLVDGYNIKAAMAPWFHGSFGDLSAEQVASDLHGMDLAVLITLLHTGFDVQFVRRALIATRVLLVVHDPNWNAKFDDFTRLVLDAAMIRPGHSRRPRLQLATIAPSVSAYVEALFQTWSAALGTSRSLDVPWIVPLFPVQLPATPPVKDLCIQGTVDVGKRSYSEVFGVVASPAVLPLVQASNDSVLVLGGGPDLDKLSPAPELANHVQVLSRGLAYTEFYEVLGSILAAYSFLDRHSTLVFDPPANATWPDPRTEGATTAWVALGVHNSTLNMTGLSWHVAASKSRHTQHPQMSSYVDAVQTVFDEKHSAVARAAAHGLKQRMLRRNVEVVSLLLLQRDCHVHQ